MGVVLASGKKEAKAADLSVRTAGCLWTFLAVSGLCVGHQAGKRKDTVGNSSVVLCIRMAPTGS